MAIIKKPTPSEMALARLRAIYLKAEQDIIREITRKRDLGLVDYGEVASLQRVQGILQNMNTEAEEYVPKMVETYFYTAEQQASASAGYANALTLTSTQTDIAETLVGNLLADITEASQTAYATAEEYLRIGRQEAGLIRQTTLELVTQGEASGKGWRTVQNQLAAELNAKGVTAFVDKAGRKWSLESYCSMATRTTGRQAQIAAALTSDDWDLWQISKIGSTCPLCSVYEGRVYSKSGTDPDYPPLSMAFGKIDPAGSNDLSNTWLNIHPNCLHSLVRYTTAGKSDKQIQAEKDFSSFEKRPAEVDYRTKKQIEAYRKKEADRARYRADVKQFEKYKAAGVEGMPVRFETFEKHKRAGDDVYKGWESKFRGLNSQAKRIENAVESGIMKVQAGGSSSISASAVRIPDKVERARVINEAINADKPIYAENLRVAYLANGIKPRDGLYDVVLHGSPHYTEYEDLYRLDNETLSYIISGRKDWKGSDIRLISCSTGYKDKYGNCVAQYLANQLGVNVYAPIDTVFIERGALTVGREGLTEQEGFIKFTPKRR